MPVIQKCSECQSDIKPGNQRCTKCGVWNFPTSKINSPIVKVEDKSATEFLEKHTVLLSNAKISPVEHIQTGIVDSIFGKKNKPGMARKSLNMIGGAPGAGKTTLCLQICDNVLSLPEFYKRECLYIANEQSESELQDTAFRLSLDHIDRIRICNVMGGVDFDLGYLILCAKPIVMILDSISDWVGEDLRKAAPLCKNIKQYMVHLDSVGIVICHIVKSGGFAGFKDVEHEVDCTALFDVICPDERKPTPKDPRILHTGKNRNGPAPMAQYFKMDVEGKGLYTISEEEFEEEFDD